MIYPALISAATVSVVKRIISKQVSEGITNGIYQAKFEVDKRITEMMLSSLFNIAVNIVLLLLSIYITPLLFEQDTVIFCICFVYLSSVIHGFLNFAINLPTIFNFVFSYKLNIKKYIYEEIRSESIKRARAEINSMNFFSRFLNDIFGKSEYEIGYSIANITTKFVIARVLSIAAIMSVVFLSYIIIFRLIVAPILIESSTNLTLFDSLLYPIVFSIKYFFN